MPESESKSNSKTGYLVAIVVALIACFGGVLSAIIAKIPVPALSAYTATPIVIIVTETPNLISNSTPTETSVPTFTNSFSTDIPPETSLPSATNTPYTDSVSIQLGEINIENGIGLHTGTEDGQHQVVSKAGYTARETVFPSVTNPENAYLYFYVNDNFYFNNPQPIEITVTYFDEGYNTIFIDYDAAAYGTNPSLDIKYKVSLLAYRNNTKTWKTASVIISDAYFTNHQNGSTDFRISTKYPQPLAVSYVEIKKILQQP